MRPYLESFGEVGSILLRVVRREESAMSPYVLRKKKKERRKKEKEGRGEGDL
jgi:hypothetical protein